MARTKKDDVLVVEVEASMGQIEDDLTKLHEEVIFEGSANQLKSRRIYNEVFKCEFGLGHFPFDHQVCSITFALVLQQASVVKLLPDCQWRLPVTSDNEQVRLAEILVLTSWILHPRIFLQIGNHNFFQGWRVHCQ